MDELKNKFLGQQEPPPKEVNKRFYIFILVLILRFISRKVVKYPNDALITGWNYEIRYSGN